MLSTTRISGLSLAGNGWSKNFTYTYDANGNIASVTENGETVRSYLYDSQNQLAIATHNGKTYSYMYDKGGNILSKTENGVTKTYSYGDSTWKDLLTAYNGNPITYDTIGNPLTYYDGKTFTWNGRQLTSVGSTTYKYNADGIRTQKIQGSNVTQYYLNGSQILASKDNFGWIYYDYDATGKVVSVNYYGTTYYYVHNLQGDVIALTDANGAIAVEYEYDPWGKMTYFGGPYMASIGLANPFRYRGYFYDSETGFYYLNSRYYDPNTGRFLNADGYISTGQGFVGLNMFAYCNNNPINYTDRTGKSPEAAAGWLGSAWLLIFADGPLPIGEIIYVGGAILILIVGYEMSKDINPPSISYDSKDAPPAPIPNNPSTSPTLPPPPPDDDDDYYDDSYDDLYEKHPSNREKIGKPKGKKPGNNQVQNKQFKQATRGLSHDKREVMHRKDTGYIDSYQEIVEAAKDLMFPVITVD